MKYATRSIIHIGVASKLNLTLAWEGGGGGLISCNNTE